MENQYRVTEETVRQAIESYRDRGDLLPQEDYDRWNGAGFLRKVLLTFKGKNPDLVLARIQRKTPSFNQMAMDYVEERLGKPSEKAPKEEWQAYLKRHSEGVKDLEREFWEMETGLEDKILEGRIPKTL